MLEKLKKLGLSERESQIYSSLINLGDLTANQIAKQTSINRTVTYNILQQLIEKGLISHIKKDKKRIYSISKPESLLIKIKEKEIIAKELIEEIKRNKSNPPSFKSVEIYEGQEGMKVIFEEIRQSKNLYVLNATGLIFKNLKYSAGHIVKDIELHGHPKVIANQSLKKTPLSKFKNIKFKYLSKESENYATTFIFGNKIIIQVLKDKPFLIKIENKEISKGYKKLFEVLWEKLD